MEIQKLNEALDNESKDTYTTDEMIGLILRGAYTGKINYETAEGLFMRKCKFTEKRAKGTIRQLIIDKEVEYQNWMAGILGQPQNFKRFELSDKGWDD